MSRIGWNLPAATLFIVVSNRLSPKLSNGKLSKFSFETSWEHHWLCHPRGRGFRGGVPIARTRPSSSSSRKMLSLSFGLFWPPTSFCIRASPPVGCDPAPAQPHTAPEFLHMRFQCPWSSPNPIQSSRTFIICSFDIN